MIILALDTVLQACSAALCDGAGHILAVRRERRAKGHAECLTGMIDAVLTESGTDIADISRIGTTVGPGSFTGVRIALSAARGIALVTGARVCGINTLEALACAAGRQAGGADVAVAIDARRGEVYFQRFGADIVPAGPPALLAVEEAAGLLSEGDVLCGSGAPLLLEARHERDGRTVAGIVSVPVEVPDAADVAALVAARLGGGGELLPPLPLYIRKPDAKLPMPRSENNVRRNS